MQKNILIINKMYYPDVGGVETIVKQHAEWLHNSGHNVTVLTANSKTWIKTSIQTINNIKVVRCSSIMFAFSMPISLSIFIKFFRLKRNFDLVYFHEPYPLGTIMGLFPSRNSKTIITWHSDIIKQKGALKSVVVYLQNKLLRKAHTVITTSKQLLEFSKQLNNVKNKTTTIPLSFEGGFSRKNTYGGYFLIIGRLSYYKGINILLEALRSADMINRKVLIVGKGEKKIEVLIRDYLKVLKNIEFINEFVSEEKKRTLIEDCYCLIFPSTENSEAFGIIQVEALSAGKPVINTLLDTGVPWVSLDNITGYSAKPKDPKSLLEKILKMDNLTMNQYDKLCENSFLRYEEFFSDRVVNIKFKKVFEKLWAN